MKLGLIGTGALTSAIVTGLKSAADNSVPVLLSPRNKEIAGSLASRYPDVRVAPDNQTVLDNCDTIMLAVRPQIAHDMLPESQFRRGHHVVSLIATLSREEITALTAPAERVTKALPMPMIAHRLGATIIFPPDSNMAALFGRLGKAIEVENSSEFDALSVVTATYATYFKYLDTIHQWLIDHGVEEAKGRDISPPSSRPWQPLRKQRRRPVSCIWRKSMQRAAGSTNTFCASSRLGTYLIYSQKVWMTYIDASRHLEPRWRPLADDR
jgi:pyrroline-5-carboxylate reductase